jgi:hypothetical protein
MQVLEPKIMRRNDVHMDFAVEVRAIARSMIKKLNQLRVERGDLQTLVPRLLYYQIGQKAYYEMLAIEYAKHVDKF